MVHLTSPYVPEYLAFREVEYLIAAISRLKEKKPNLLPQVTFTYASWTYLCHTTGTVIKLLLLLLLLLLNLLLLYTWLDKELCGDFGGVWPYAMYGYFVI